MAIFFDYLQILDLLRQGGRVEKGGIYAVWVWARTGSQVRVEVAGKRLEPTHANSGPVDREGGRFAWEQAGQVELRAGERFAVRLESLQSGLPERGMPKVGFLALAAERGFDPRQSFEVSRVFVDQAGPVRDERLAETWGVNTPRTLRIYATLEEWQARAEWIRRHILSCAGLWPLPEKRPLKPRIFGRREREGYSVEKVFFESLPGYLVCGNLYRPLGKGPFPGIANPHGHWAKGRLENSELGSIPGRCIGLARQGHVAFSYDMAGYVDSIQIDHRGFGGRREDLWGIGVLGLQLWNSIRVLDFLESLPEVDPERLGCTGASGGGTQTFLLTAVDSRVKAAAPVNMVSAHMQGGCNCENQGHLRLKLDNVEIASCAAPRPLLLVSATGDWTADTPELEYPAIRSIYRLFGAEDQVECVQFDAPHNYNQQSREAVYAFFGRVFLGEADRQKFQEQPFQVEQEEDLRVFAGGGLPAGSLDQQGVVAALIARSEERLAAQRFRHAAGWRRFRATMAPALQHALSVEEVKPANLYVRRMGRSRRDSFLVERLILGRREEGERIPALLFLPRPMPARGDAVLVVHSKGKAGLADLGRGRPGRLVMGLLERGLAVLAIDPFLVGEFHSPFGRRERDLSEPHFYTYNQATAACRVQDLLTGIAYLNSRSEMRACHLIGLGQGGVYSLFARAFCPQVERTAVDLNRLALAEDAVWMEEELFVPAIRSAGDLRTALALIAPGPLRIYGAGRDFPTSWAEEAYRAAGCEEQLAIWPRRPREEELVDWIAGESEGFASGDE